MTTDESVVWEVKTHPMKMLRETGHDQPTRLPDEWEPFATSVSQTGKTWVWLRRSVQLKDSLDTSSHL